MPMGNINGTFIKKLNDSIKASDINNAISKLKMDNINSIDIITVKNIKQLKRTEKFFGRERRKSRRKY